MGEEAENWEHNKRINAIRQRIAQDKRNSDDIELYPEDIITILEVLDHLTEVDER